MERVDLTEFAQQNRMGMTPAERALWQVLRREQTGVKFRRQQKLGFYILDFYSAQVRLGIEVDGSAHEGLEQYDAERDAKIRAEGIEILRFTNEEVLEGLDVVLGTIKDAIDRCLHFRY